MDERTTLVKLLVSYISSETLTFRMMSSFQGCDYSPPTDSNIDSRSFLHTIRSTVAAFLETFLSLSSNDEKMPVEAAPRMKYQAVELLHASAQGDIQRLAELDDEMDRLTSDIQQNALKLGESPQTTARLETELLTVDVKIQQERNRQGHDAMTTKELLQNLVDGHHAIEIKDDFQLVEDLNKYSALQIDIRMLRLVDRSALAKIHEGNAKLRQCLDDRAHFIAIWDAERSESERSTTPRPPGAWPVADV